MKRLVAVLAIATVVMTACGSNDDGAATQDNGGPIAATPGTEASGRQGSSDGGLTARSPEKATVVVAEAGMTTGTNSLGTLTANAGAILKNTSSSDAAFFEVIFNFKDAAGNPVATETEYVNALEAGATGYAAVDFVELSAVPTTVEVTAIVDDTSFFTGAVFPSQVTGIAKQPYGSGLEVTGTVTNPTDEVVEFASVTCVLLAGGKVVGGASGGLDSIPPGATQQWEAQTFSSIEIVADAASCAVDSSL